MPSKKSAPKTDKTGTIDKLTKPRKNEKLLGKRTLQKTVESPDFYTKAYTDDGRFFFYFNNLGDFVKGRLLGKRANADVHRSNSYRMELCELNVNGKNVPVDYNEIVEFFANRQLQRTIDRNELIGSLVRIAYIGKKKTRFGHYQKVYAVYKDLGVASRKESFQNEGKPSKPKKSRPGPTTKAGRERGRQRRARQDTARVIASV